MDLNRRHFWNAGYLFYHVYKVSNTNQHVESPITVTSPLNFETNLIYVGGILETWMEGQRKRGQIGGT